MKSLYEKIREAVALTPTAFNILLKGNITYASPAGDTYELRYCVEEMETPEHARNVELVPCR
jgi:hypothetical protein